MGFLRIGRFRHDTTRYSSHVPIDQWLVIQKEATLKIDPATAEADWSYAQTQPCALLVSFAPCRDIPANLHSVKEAKLADTGEPDE
jgi:hypothetical protein